MDRYLSWRNIKDTLKKRSRVGIILACAFILPACGQIKEQVNEQAKEQTKEEAKEQEKEQTKEEAKEQTEEQVEEKNQKAVTVINMECFDEVKGEYRIQGCESEDENVYVAGYWMLSFFEAEEGPYLSIYDCGAGNPGVEGYIIAMDEESVNVQIDPDYYEELPKANWADQGGILYLQYELTGEGILLYNGGKETVLEGVRVYPEDE